VTEVRDYHKAVSIEHALALAARAEPPVRFLAGGTDLLMELARPQESAGQAAGLPRPELAESRARHAASLPSSEPGVTLIDVADVPEMTRIEWSGSGLTIGASVKLADLLEAGLDAGGLGLLAQGAAEVGSPQIRHLATIGGNVCNASPSADTAAPLLALAAEARLASADGERTVPLSRFWLGPGKTMLRPGEMLAALHVPRPAAGAAGVYLKHKVRGAMDLAIVGVAVLLSGAEGRWDARIALAAVAPTPIRATAAEQFLGSRSVLDGAALREAARLAEEAAAPIDDVRASAAYRRAMVRRLAERALKLAGARRDSVPAESGA
jgi:carbon-monoxide dehydrogenase medium subunit